MALRFSSKFLKSALIADSSRYVSNHRYVSSLVLLSSSSRPSSSTNNFRFLGQKNLSSPAQNYRLLTASYSTDVALRDFLKDEIEAEKQLAQQQLGAQQSAPTISGFDVKADEAEVTLTKKHNNEKITVTFNVNDCVRPDDQVDTGSMEKYEQQMQQQQQDEDKPLSESIVAEPAFKVEIEKGGQKLVFECEFDPEYSNTAEGDVAQEQNVQEEDVPPYMFHISGVYLTTGEYTDKIYGASGEILDGTLYDHLIDYLAERGVDNKFADELIRFSTHYEHAQYVNLLQKLREFVSK